MISESKVMKLEICLQVPISFSFITFDLCLLILEVKVCCNCFQTMRIDVSSVGKSRIDTARKVYYAPVNIDHLLVITENNKLLKFESKTGRIIAEVNLLALT